MKPMNSGIMLMTWFCSKKETPKKRLAGPLHRFDGNQEQVDRNWSGAK